MFKTGSYSCMDAAIELINKTDNPPSTIVART